MADLGGPTPTHALRFDSPALDAGHSGGLTTDQRGLPRPIDDPNTPNAADGAESADRKTFEAAIAASDAHPRKKLVEGQVVNGTIAGTEFISDAARLDAFSAASYALTAFAVAVIVASSASKRRDQRRRLARSRAAFNNSLEDRAVTLLQAVPPWRVVYGRCIVGGDIVAIFTSDKAGTRNNGTTYTKPDAYKHLVIVLAAHEVQAINEVYIEGVALGEGVVGRVEAVHAEVLPRQRDGGRHHTSSGKVSRRRSNMK